MQGSSFNISPRSTPKALKWFIAITVICSILSPIITFAFAHYFNLPGPSEWFTLSLWGLKKGWVWQPITYAFIQTAGSGITISLFFSLLFHMFLLWIAGSEVCTRYGQSRFALFYLSSILICGLTATAALFLFHSPTLLVGSSPAIYALLTLWIMLHPELDLFFLLFIRIKARVLFLIFIGIALLIQLSSGQVAQFTGGLTGVIWGFLWGKYFWKLAFPFPIEKPPPKKWNKYQDEKIIDITDLKDKDDLFMEAMLDKISKEGKESLTSRQKERMRRISERKHRK